MIIILYANCGAIAVIASMLEDDWYPTVPVQSTLNLTLPIFLLA